MYTTDLEARQVGVLVRPCRGKLYWDTSSFGLETLTNIIGILIYDHTATLPEEIAFIWSRPKALSAMLFLFNRYAALLGNIFGLFSDFLPVSNKVLRCCACYSTGMLTPHLRRGFSFARQVLIFSQQVFICLILSLRTYALYGCSKRLLKWMAIIGLVLTVGALAATFGYDSNSATDGDCHVVYTAVTSVRHAMAWVAMFIYELLIFVLTVIQTCKTRGFPRLSLVSRRDILDVIFHDGVMYFAGMTLVNLPNILTYFFVSDIIKGGLGPFTSCMSVTLISRLMLNLHESIDTGIFSTPAGTSLDVLTTRVDVQSAVSSHH
ncbi:hypothetical protein DFJ58DRAFT_723886 [Suillus subalutaceus]|uniref:uncharacterized protein n=1 Tax=Suillus subalutaceus TaxID=48586 RepID=UPI001B87FC4F|nr:uncharacterized protein DFJ58DRAFT_723886 [Suillus subalutaceus]KAG1867198.1 hypothetical protein DFJ58DRAFT_723886 [Suillus subalutaceus]